MTLNPSKLMTEYLYQTQMVDLKNFYEPYKTPKKANFGPQLYSIQPQVSLNSTCVQSYTAVYLIRVWGVNLIKFYDHIKLVGKPSN